MNKKTDCCGKYCCLHCKKCFPNAVRQKKKTEAKKPDMADWASRMHFYTGYLAVDDEENLRAFNKCIKDIIAQE